MQFTATAKQEQGEGVGFCAFVMFVRSENKKKWKKKQKKKKERKNKRKHYFTLFP